MSATDSQSVSAARSLSTTSARRTLSSNSAGVSGGRCDCEQLLVALLADERAVLLERRDREDALRDFLVADPDAEALGFGERRALVDHLLQDLLLDAELLQQLLAHVAAVRRAVRLQLRLIRAPEFVGA